MSGLYHGLNRGAETLAAHNRNVPADTQSDACTCDLCRAADAGPASDAAAPAAGPARRGPVQDESGRLDPLDAHAMRVIEGRLPADDLDDCTEVYGR